MNPTDEHSFSMTDLVQSPLLVLNSSSQEILYANQFARRVFNLDSDCTPQLTDLFRAEEIGPFLRFLRSGQDSETHSTFLCTIDRAANLTEKYEVRATSKQSSVYLTFSHRADLDRFSSLSHNLNNPLAIVATSAELALKQHPDHRTERLLYKIINSAQRMKDIIQTDLVR